MKIAGFENVLKSHQTAHSPQFFVLLLLFPLFLTHKVMANKYTLDFNQDTVFLSLATHTMEAEVLE